MHWLGSKSLSQSDAAGDANRRSRGRVRLGGVESNLGPILDLSATGARILSEKLQQGLIKLSIGTAEEGVNLSAEIVWGRKIAHRQFMLGIRFLEVTTEQQRTLAQIASSYRLRSGS